MPEDNPYAAPQTLETLASTRIVLPVAEERADPKVRILFPEVDTQSLSRIEAASRAIRRMTIVWSLGLALFIIGFISTMMSGNGLGKVLILAAGIFLLAFRISAGVERGPSQRYYSLLVDPALCLAFLYSTCSDVIHWTQSRHFAGEVPLALLLFLALLYIPVTSVLAHWRYGCLFGEQLILHDELARELSHRRRNRIP